MIIEAPLITNEQFKAYFGEEDEDTQGTEGTEGASIYKEQRQNMGEQ